MLALVIAGISVLVFLGMMSPYRRAADQLKRLTPEVDAAVAADRFNRYLALEIKEVIDLGLISEDIEKRPIQLERHTGQVAPMREKAATALADLEASLRAAGHASSAGGHNRRMMATIESDYPALAAIEQRILDAANGSNSNKASVELIEKQFRPTAQKIAGSGGRCCRPAGGRTAVSHFPAYRRTGCGLTLFGFCAAGRERGHGNQRFQVGPRPCFRAPLCAIADQR